MVDFTKEDCIISTHNGRADVINYHLAIRQKLTKEEVQQLVESHQFKDALYDKMCSTEDVSKLKDLAADVENLLFKQQKLWHFPQDSNFHAFWEMPKCSCPKIDNNERIGTPYTIKAKNCILHGWE